MPEAISNTTSSGAMPPLSHTVIDLEAAQGQHKTLAYRHPVITRARFLAEIAKHQEQDKVLQGAYWDWEKDKGCAIGCAFSSIAVIADDLRLPTERDNHPVLATHLGIDEDLLRVEDFIFEHLPAERARLWPLEFSSAITAGADTSGIVNGLIATSMRTLYAPATDTPPAWAAIARRVADGIDAEWKVRDWLNLRTEFPDDSWPLPYRAVTYLLAKLRGDTFLKNDALQDFLLQILWFDDLMEWTADALLTRLRDAPIGIAEAASAGAA